MAAIEKRGQYLRAKIRRKGFPDQSRSFDTRADAEMWARAIKSEMDRGLYVDRTEAEKNLLSALIDRYLREVTPGKRGAGHEESRLRTLQRRPIAHRSRWPRCPARTSPATAMNASSRCRPARSTRN